MSIVRCGSQHHDLTAQHADLHTDLADLAAKEKQLDDLIKNAELQLKLLNEDKTDAYVTYQDLRSVARFKNQTVLAIKAPPEAKLHVPHPSEVTLQRIKKNPSNDNNSEILVAAFMDVLPTSEFLSFIISTLISAFAGATNLHAE